MTVSDIPPDFIGTALVILLLGMRHGFDADHLAAIDAIAQFNSRARPALARRAGTLFALGHGCVFVGIALTVSVLAQAWQVPRWLEAFGAWVSISALTLLALLNIACVLRTPPQETARVVGLRSRLFGRLLRAGNPGWVMGVGALFALSFDTVSQATLFAVMATPFGGWQPALLLALSFVAGMLLTDGLNGWWIARLIRRSDRSAYVASRVMALTIAGIGLLTAGLGAASRALPEVDAWSDDKAWWFGAAILGVVFVSYRLGQRLSGGQVQSAQRGVPGIAPSRHG
jgi:nickel/cobalt transporter (NiCoT) family protein